MLRQLRQLGRWIQTSGLFFWRAADTRWHREHLRLGAAGERLATRYLRGLGYRILERGHRQKLGEIDIIAVDGQCLVFVEVKTWRTGDQDPSLAVDRGKQDKLTRAALVYLKRHRLLDQPSRFDVISIVWDGDWRTEPQLRHFRHAFEASGRGQLFR